MKTCRRCGSAKPLEDFQKTAKTPSGRNNTCKRCIADAALARYHAMHADSRRRQNRQRAARIAQRYERVAALKDVPCADCGGRFPRVCMDFDHVRGEKIDSVSSLVRKVTVWDQILAEIAKCDVVCANCHRIRTAARGEWGLKVAI